MYTSSHICGIIVYKLMSKEVIMNKEIEKYLTDIVTSYAEFAGRRNSSDPSDRIETFKNALSFSFGTKYIKVMSKTSVHSFIVNTDNDAKFKKGDILMAASWAAPARNFARGNVFNATNASVSWTGAS